MSLVHVSPLVEAEVCPEEDVGLDDNRFAIR